MRAAEPFAGLGGPVRRRPRPAAARLCWIRWKVSHARRTAVLARALIRRATSSHTHTHKHTHLPTSSISAPHARTVTRARARRSAGAGRAGGGGARRAAAGVAARRHRPSVSAARPALPSASRICFCFQGKDRFPRIPQSCRIRAAPPPSSPSSARDGPPVAPRHNRLHAYSLSIPFLRRRRGRGLRIGGSVADPFYDLLPYSLPPPSLDLA